MPKKIGLIQQFLKRRYGMKFFQESKQAISFFDNTPSVLIFQTFTVEN